MILIFDSRPLLSCNCLKIISGSFKTTSLPTKQMLILEKIVHVDDLTPAEQGTKVTTKCMDCDFFSPVCSKCFIDPHIARYTHWAHVWDDTIGCYVRKDISCLGYVIHLGHEGKPCPHASTTDGDIFFHIVDNNGMHDTRLHFCACLPQVDHASQLLKHKLFPATMLRPKMAFTFCVLDFYNILHVGK